MSDTPSNGPENDFDAIASAVQATERGRNFLIEFARRKSEREHATLRTAVTQLEHAIAREMSRPAEPRQVVAEAPTSEELLGRIDHAVAEVDGIISTTTNTVASSLKIAKDARFLAKRAGERDATLAASLSELASAIEVQGYLAQVGSRTREIFDVLTEVREHLGDMAERSKRPAAKIIPLRLVASNDSAPTERTARLRTLSEEERIALFT